MLAITDTAAEAIRSLTAGAELPDGGGLRIAATYPDRGLELSLAARPVEDDTVLVAEGFTLFLESTAAQVLDDKVLDIEPVTTPEGEEELRFAIGPQRGGSPAPPEA